MLFKCWYISQIKKGSTKLPRQYLLNQSQQWNYQIINEIVRRQLVTIANFEQVSQIILVFS